MDRRRTGLAFASGSGAVEGYDVDMVIDIRSLMRVAFSCHSNWLDYAAPSFRGGKRHHAQAASAALR